ncbi:restriction endonuclease subunit S [Enterobacter sp. CP102]|uniref:restriction endonuclease subunit S n=1 Tax=Enterobacter sp. CP102 TaxID=2976431 RepID=UPI0022018742|nr:restriction endonuclease subunit S [Enterobacter sp. CP102]UWM64768.1 restriction endonuclease subunit S [Enterobacter sp. CP102]
MSGGKLPEGWVATTLQNIAVWGSGGTPSRSHDEFYNGNIPWIKTGDLGPRLITEASEYITEAGVKNSSAKYFPKGSVAIAMYGATIGKTSILGIDATTNQACAVGSPIEDITSSIFLYYFLLNEKNAFIKKGKGGAQPNISQAVIKEHPLSLPPYAEQKIIAEKLDTLLAQVDSTKARLEKIPQILKRFRQAVLAAAATGNLNQNISSNNKKNTLKEVGIMIKTGPFGSALHKSDYISNGIPVINPMHINDGIISPSLCMTISDEKYAELSSWSLQDGDIIVGRRGEMGRAAMVNLNQSKMLCGTGSMILRTKENIVPKYLELILRSPTAINYFNKEAVGSTMVNLNQKVINSLEVYLPHIEEQLEIIRRVEQLFAYADTIEKQVNSALTRVNNLTQSILAKAFRGELTAQWRAENPDLISGENSAAALLERIKAERAASGGKKTSRKKS